jgi:hypothetical protein
MTSRFAIAKDAAVTALDELVPELFGGGKKQTRRAGNRWEVAPVKWRSDAKLTQMSVYRSGGGRGAFKDYVSGVKGDAIDLVAYGLEGIVHADSRIRAVEWLEDRFGIRNMPEERRREIAIAAGARQAELAAADAKRLGSERRRSQKFYFGCEPTILGTLAEIYLGSRAIELARVPYLSAALRFRPDCGYWLGAQRDGEGNKLGRDPEFPAMIAAMVDRQGNGPHACHYTFLEPDGSSKLKTRDRGYVDEAGKGKSAKLMFPASGGLSIPLTYGRSGLKIAEAAAAGKLGWMGITEGIEDALSVAVTNAELRMHAAGSLAHLGAIADCPAARGYLVFKDNDWGKPQAQAQFDQAIARLRSFGKPVEALAMPAAWGKDVNDALQHEERD